MDGLDRHLWAQARQYVLDRDGHRCTAAEYDSNPCSDGPINVHHVDPDADPYDTDLLVALCPRHHRILHHLMRENACV